MSEKGKLIIFSGPSGVGKGTVLSELFKMDDKAFLSISATTRSPRPGEIHGVNYWFISKDEFEEKIQAGQMLEYAKYCDNYYGTPLDTVDKMRNEGYNVILEIEVQGAKQAKKKCPDALSVFLLPPSLTDLRNRLVGRQTETMEVMKARLEAALNEIEAASTYEYLIVNNQVDKAAKELYDIINTNVAKTKCKQKLLKEVLSK